MLLLYVVGVLRSTVDRLLTEAYEEGFDAGVDGDEHLLAYWRDPPIKERLHVHVLRLREAGFAAGRTSISGGDVGGAGPA